MCRIRHVLTQHPRKSSVQWRTDCGSTIRRTETAGEKGGAVAVFLPVLNGPLFFVPSSLPSETRVRCTCVKQVLLRTTTPDNVLVTPEWDAILRPNYSHAYEAQRWTTVSVRAQQQQRHALRPSGATLDKLLAAPFTNATSSDYQASSLSKQALIAPIRKDSMEREDTKSRWEKTE